MRLVHSCLHVAGLLLLGMASAAAATYTVGPSGRQHTQLSEVFSSRNLEPGDIVLVDGNATYNGGIIVGSNDGGTQSNPVIIRWNRAAGASRPILSGGNHTIKFQQSNHVVFEGFEVTGGSLSCVFSEAHNIVVRDAVIHDCPGQGILGADNNSGSFTLEYSEIYRSGNGIYKHSIYMQSDEIAYPGSVFVMRFNYVHDGLGGNLLKNRHERSLVHYNWFEGSAYQELELIGPDCFTQQSGWTPDTAREDVELVGNVIVHTSNWPNAIRAGGDLNGRNQGRVRMVNNTIIFNRAGTANAVYVQLGQGSLEMHNNLVYQTTGGTPAIVRENPASSVEAPYCAPMSREPWSNGRKVAGSNNWVQAGATHVPTEWTGTITGANPQLVNVSQYQLRPAASSPLVSAANDNPPSPTAFPFPSPQLLPAYDAPARVKMAIGGQVARGYGPRIDIGAYEASNVTQAVPVRGNGGQPLVPGQTGAAMAAPAAAVAARPAGTVATSGRVTATAVHDTLDSPGDGQSLARKVTITPPLVVAWHRLKHWMSTLAGSVQP